MTWRAVVEANPARWTVRIKTARQLEHGATEYIHGDLSVSRVPSSEGFDRAIELPEDAARAIHAALGRYLGAVESPEQLRRDYEAERARVDTFIAHLTVAP